ncbi:MAG: hypothetical protein R3B45_16235 [Bdellovibrionota bacterium]
MKLNRLVVLFAVALIPAFTTAQAAEISLIKAFYQSSKVTDGLDTTNITLGGRYSDYTSAKMAWYGDFALALKSYSADSNEPGNMTDIHLGGGVRYYFSRMSEKITPYLAGGGYYKSETSKPNWSPASTTWTEEKGIYYRGDVGLRLDFSPEFFFEIEIALFDSPLSAKTSMINKTDAGETKVSTDEVYLYADTFSPLFDLEEGNVLNFSLGMKI